MKKRILCTLLSAAMLLTSSPVVFAAETQPVKEQQTKETLPFTIKEANNDCYSLARVAELPALLPLHITLTTIPRFTTRN